MRRIGGWIGVARWLPAAAWAAGIFLFSSLPGSAIPGPLVDYTTLAHVGEYAVLGTLVLFGLGRRIDTRTAVIVVVACAVYAASDEVHQLFVQGRSADLLDWLADVIGSASGVALCSLAARRRA